MIAPDVGNGISVCIPTYRRPTLLRECVESAFANAFRPLEILVSDDDFGQQSKEALRTLTPPSGILLRHIPGPSARSQAANANHLFEQAQYERVILLHDDDLLTPGAVDRLVQEWERLGGHVDAIFGRQYITNAEGVTNQKLTRENDATYFKTTPEGVQASPLWSALVGQFPNDGMMMRRSIARAVRYPSEQEVGHLPVDFHFGVCYALKATQPFVLLHSYLAMYRYSELSVGRSVRNTYDGQIGYELLNTMEVSSPLEKQALRLALDRYAASAVMGYLASGRPGRAAHVLLQHFFRLNKRWPTRLALAGLVAAECVGVRVLKARMGAHAK